VPRGEISAESGKLAGETLAKMIDLALDERIDAITFAPLNKAALHAGGWKYNDEHQMFANLTNHQGFFGEFNVPRPMVDVARHLARVAANRGGPINGQRIDDALTLADRTMRDAGFDSPRIAVCALNPHGGENGLFGYEEIEIIRPAVERGKKRGILCEGPFPSDTIYLKVFNGEYDGALSMYHDQGRSRSSSRASTAASR
jgi:4-hydroxythreonine-4-phosphate dehydrogenase